MGRSDIFWCRIFSMEDEKKMRETEKRTKYKLDLYGDVYIVALLEDQVRLLEWLHKHDSDLNYEPLQDVEVEVI